MGNCEFTIPESIQKHWSNSTKEGQKIIRNDITLEEFKLIKIASNGNESDIQKLVERSIYSIPKTPKIILLQSGTEELSFLLQVTDEKISTHLSKINIFTDLLEIVKDFLTVFHCLFKRYGPFFLTEKMLSLSNKMQVMAWINEQKDKGQVQYPRQFSQKIEQQMITEILDLIQEHTTFNLKFSDIRSTYNFKEAIANLEEIIIIEKLKKQVKTKMVIPKCIVRVSSLSPEKLRILSPPKNNLLIKNIKKMDVPKFIANKKKSNVESDHSQKRDEPSFLSKKWRKTELKQVLGNDFKKEAGRVSEVEMKSPNIKERERYQSSAFSKLLSKGLKHLEATATSTFLGEQRNDIPKRKHLEAHSGPLTHICQKLTASRFIDVEVNNEEINISADPLTSRISYESVQSTYISEFNKVLLE